MLARSEELSLLLFWYAPDPPCVFDQQLKSIDAGIRTTVVRSPQPTQKQTVDAPVSRANRLNFCDFGCKLWILPPCYRSFSEELFLP
jgi:hypothetical protein